MIDPKQVKGLKDAIKKLGNSLDLVDEIFERRKYFLDHEYESDEDIFKDGITAAIQVLTGEELELIKNEASN
jgi:hypothetical protein